LQELKDERPTVPRLKISALAHEL